MELSSSCPWLVLLLPSLACDRPGMFLNSGIGNRIAAEPYSTFHCLEGLESEDNGQGL